MAYTDQTPGQGDLQCHCIYLVLKPSLQNSSGVSISGAMSGRKLHGNSAINAQEVLEVGAPMQVRIENSHVHGITQAMVSSADLPDMR